MTSEITLCLWRNVGDAFDLLGNQGMIAPPAHYVVWLITKCIHSLPARHTVCVALCRITRATGHQNCKKYHLESLFIFFSHFFFYYYYSQVTWAFFHWNAIFVPHDIRTRNSHSKACQLQRAATVHISVCQILTQPGVFSRCREWNKNKTKKIWIRGAVSVLLLRLQWLWSVARLLFVFLSVATQQ